MALSLKLDVNSVVGRPGLVEISLSWIAFHFAEINFATSMDLI